MTHQMPKDTAYSHPLRIADLKKSRAHRFALEPDAATRGAIAADLGIPALRKLRFAGQLEPLGRDDWRLVADLGATVVQDCVVSLQPVTTRIDEPVLRSYLAAPPEVPAGEEAEMPEDDSVEPLPASLDLGAVMFEALALALPPYPHAEGVAPLQYLSAEPGLTPMSDEDAKPFAGLAGLRDKLSKKSD